MHGRGPAVAPPAARVEIWELEIWKSENLEIQKFGIQTKHKTRITKSKSMSPHMCGVVGKSSWPHFVPFVTNFPMDRKMQKQSKKLRISVGGPMLLSTQLVRLLVFIVFHS